MNARSSSSLASALIRTAMITLPILVILLTAGFYSHKPGPCRDPLTYRIGSVDDMFWMTRQEFAREVAKAVAIWENAAGYKLFREDPGGALEINLVYDHRQAASDRLKGIGDRIDNTKGSYEALRAHFEQLDVEYRQQHAVLVADVDAYNARVRDLKAANDAASKGGGVSTEVYRQLTAEKEALDAIFEDIRARQEELRKNAETLQSMVVVINEIATSLNLEVVRYNETGKELGEEFSEGVYERKNGHQTVNIYHFSDRTRLVRVLAHELGHALGLKHNDNPKSLMYRLNLAENVGLSPEDIADLKALCGRER
jgi:hypothetical protein